MLTGALLILGESRTAAAVPAAMAGAFACVRWPATAIGGSLLLVGLQNPLTAHLGLSVGGLLDGFLVALWLAAGWMLFRERHRRAAWLWPGLVALSLYPIASVFAIPSADTLQLGFDSFRLSSWHLLGFVAIAVAPWPEGTYERVAKGVIGAVLVAALYSVFRKIGGSPDEEIRLARTFSIGLPFLQPVPFFGSFFTAQDLATWMACVIPFSLALALHWSGIWRVVAVAAVGLSAFALLAADRRSAVVGAVAGVLLVLALFALSARAFGGRRFGVVLIAVGAAVTIGSALYSVTIATDPESAERFEGLVSAPTEEETFQIRQSRWEVALESSEENPLGVGLAEVGALTRQNPNVDSDLIVNLDSSYLKIAYEQGFSVLAIFVAGLVVLLAGLILRSTRARDPLRAALGIGACGTLAAMSTLFYTSFFIESLSAIAAWILVGIGAAQFTVVRRRPTA